VRQTHLPHHEIAQALDVGRAHENVELSALELEAGIWREVTQRNDRSTGLEVVEDPAGCDVPGKGVHDQPKEV
jgi:hypothetical protein